MDTNGPLLVVSTVGEALYMQITEEPACDQRQSLKNGSSGLALNCSERGMLCTWYFDTTDQKYVFGPPRMAEIRGASALRIT